MDKVSWPLEGLESLGCCPICGSAERKTAYADASDRLYGAPGTWTLYRCLDCLVCYLDPRPNSKTVGLAYASYHTHVAASRNPDNLLGKAKLALRNGYLNNTWNTSLRPSLPLLARVLTQLFPKWMRMRERQILRDLPKPAKGTLLDIGCGAGSFLKMAKMVGWSVQGIDFDWEAVKVARKEGIDARQGGIELFDGQNDLFDVVTVSHVIEHVHEPRKLVEACLRILKPGGTFWIETPNFDSHGRKLFGKDWRGLEPPRHLVLFNTENLSKLLADSGFRNIRHAEWMPQFGPMYQASKNIRNRVAIGSRNLSILERIKIKIVDHRLKRDFAEREYITLICEK